MFCRDSPLTGITVVPSYLQSGASLRSISAISRQQLCKPASSRLWYESMPS